MILPFERNSVGAPYETPIICPAQPPRILSSSVARERRREAPCWGRAKVGASATHTVNASQRESHSGVLQLEFLHLQCRSASVFESALSISRIFPASGNGFITLCRLVDCST